MGKKKNFVIRGIPFVGNIVQAVSGDSPKDKIKMKLRRISVALAGGSVPFQVYVFKISALSEIKLINRDRKNAKLARLK